MITRDETAYLKAIAILSIILCHFWGWICEPIQMIKTMGSSLAQSGVFLFLFLSGYGVMQSYLKNGLNHFWSKRFYKVYIPFLVVAIPELFLEIWRYHANIQDMYVRSTFLSAIGLFPNNLLDSTFWFIPFILLQYLIFFCSFSTHIGNKGKKGLYLLLVIVGYLIFKRYFTWASKNDIYGFGFWIGSMVSGIKHDKINLKKMLWGLAGTVCLVGYSFTLIWFEYAGVRFINCLCLCFLEIIGVRFFTSFVRDVKWLKWIGNYSYELFLTEGFFFSHKILYDIVGYNYLGLILHFGIILVLAFFIRMISEKVRDFINTLMITKHNCIAKKGNKF